MSPDEASLRCDVLLVRWRLLAGPPRSPTLQAGNVACLTAQLVFFVRIRMGAWRATGSLPRLSNLDDSTHLYHQIESILLVSRIARL